MLELSCLDAQLHKEALQAELKLVREDLHRVSLELGERTQRAEKLHAKFDIIAGSQTGPDGEVHSQVSLQGQTIELEPFTVCYCLLGSSLPGYAHVALLDQ